MRVEVLFLDGCANYERLLPRVRELALQAGADLVLRRVDTLDEAQAQRFLGSPTVRVDGRDIEPGAAGRSDYGLTCRIYRSPQLGSAPVPPEQWLRDALAH